MNSNARNSTNNAVKAMVSVCPIKINSRYAAVVSAAPIIAARPNPIRSDSMTVSPSPRSSATPIMAIAKPRLANPKPKADSIQAPKTTKRLSLAALIKKMNPRAPEAGRFRTNDRQLLNIVAMDTVPAP